MNIKAIVLKKKPRNFPGLWLSVSKIKTFQQCKAKYRYCYIDRIPGKTWEHLIFGNFLHKVLEVFHLRILEGNENISLSQLMTKAFSDVLKMDDYQIKLLKSQKDEAFNILKIYLYKLKNGGIPDITDVELSFYVDIDGKVLLTGLIDRVQLDDNLLHVSDYKTTKKKQYLMKDYFQLLTYAYVMCLIDEGLEKVKTSYILLRHDFDYISKVYDRKQVMKVGQDYLNIADKINGEKLWRPSVTPLCEYCDYQDICKDGKKFIPRKKKQNYDDSFGFKNW